MGNTIGNSIGNTIGNTYINLARQSLTQYAPKMFKPSLSYFDRCALKWIKDHSNTIVVLDCDKGLGDALLSKTWVQNKAMSLINDVCIRSHTTDLDIWRAQCMVQDVVLHHKSASHISSSVSSFLLERIGSRRVGSFRIRPKIHKIELDARPIFNFSSSWIQPIAVFLCDVLEPIQKSCQHVVVNSYALVK